MNSEAKLTFKNISIGLVFGIVFGILDNITLYTGIDGLEEFLKKYFNMDNLDIAGWANVYSNSISALFGTFFTIIFASQIKGINANDFPIWVNAIGIMIGSIIGVYLPKMFIKFYHRVF